MGREEKLKVQVNFVFSSVLTFLTRGKKINMEMQMLLISATIESNALHPQPGEEEPEDAGQTIKTKFFTPTALKMEMLGNFSTFQR